MKKMIVLLVVIMLSFGMYHTCLAADNVKVTESAEPSGDSSAESSGDSSAESSEDSSANGYEAYLGNSDGEGYEVYGIDIGKIISIVSESSGKTDGALNVVAYIIDVMNENEEESEEGKEEDKETEISGILRSISELVVAFQSNDTEKIAEEESYLINSLIQNGAISNLSSEQLHEIDNLIENELAARGDL